MQRCHVQSAIADKLASCHHGLRSGQLHKLFIKSTAMNDATPRSRASEINATLVRDQCTLDKNEGPLGVYLDTAEASPGLSKPLKGIMQQDACDVKTSRCLDIPSCSASFQ